MYRLTLHCNFDDVLEAVKHFCSLKRTCIDCPIENIIKTTGCCWNQTPESILKYENEIIEALHLEYLEEN